jgi:hypothetical protein
VKLQITVDLLNRRERMEEEVLSRWSRMRLKMKQSACPLVVSDSKLVAIIAEAISIKESTNN